MKKRREVRLDGWCQDLIAHHGSVRAAAKALKVNHAYLHRIAAGQNHNPSDAVLVKLGLGRTPVKCVVL